MLAIVSCLLFVLVPLVFSVSYYIRKIALAIFGSRDSPISGVAGVVFIILLLSIGLLAPVIGSVSWVVVMKPVFGREEMRKLIVYGGRIPVIEELLLKVWAWVYR